MKKLRILVGGKSIFVIVLSLALLIGAAWTGTALAHSLADEGGAPVSALGSATDTAVGLDSAPVTVVAEITTGHPCRKARVRPPVPDHVDLPIAPPHPCRLGF